MTPSIARINAAVARFNDQRSAARAADRQQLLTEPVTHGWKSGAAADSLARALYVCRCRFYGSTVQPWERVPYNIRAGFVELAIRTLRSIGQPTGEGPDPLFPLADDIARFEYGREKILATISPETPWGVRS